MQELIVPEIHQDPLMFSLVVDSMRLKNVLKRQAIVDLQYIH